MVAQLGPVGSVEPRIEAQDGSVGAQLGKAGKEHGGIHHHSRKAYLLLCEQVGHHKESGDGAYQHTQVIGQGPFDTLFCYDTHDTIRRTHYDVSAIKFTMPVTKCKSTTFFRNFDFCGTNYFGISKFICIFAIRYFCREECSHPRKFLNANILTFYR